MAITDAQAIRFRGRSYFALTLTPEAPLSAWLTRLDACLARSPGFFGASPVILDLQGLELAKADALDLVGALAQRGLRILGLDGAKAEWTGADLPPHIASGRDACAVESQTRATAPNPAEPVRKPAPQLIIEEPVRSGQCVTHAEGDVIVIGSVGSGAEIIAAGSIHIYGALRGRAMAGAYGDESARIFCRKLEAELIAINGLYQTSDEIEARMRLQPVSLNLDLESAFTKRRAEAYERLVLDAMIGDGTLFIRGDETERSWQLCTPVLEHWAKQGRTGLDTYASGAWGPKSAEDLLAANGHSWREP